MHANKNHLQIYNRLDKSLVGDTWLDCQNKELVAVTKDLNNLL